MHRHGGPSAEVAHQRSPSAGPPQNAAAPSAHGDAQRVLSAPPGGVSRSVLRLLEGKATAFFGSGAYGRVREHDQAGRKLLTDFFNPPLTGRVGILTYFFFSRMLTGKMGRLKEVAHWQEFGCPENRWKEKTLLKSFRLSETEPSCEPM